MIAKMEIFDSNRATSVTNELQTLKNRLIQLGQYNESDFEKLTNEVQSDCTESLCSDKYDTKYYVCTLPWINRMLKLSKLPGFDFNRLKDCEYLDRLCDCAEKFPKVLEECPDYSRIKDWQMIMENAPELITKFDTVDKNCKLWIEEQLDQDLLFYDDDTLRILRHGDLILANCGTISKKVKQLALIANFFELDVEPLAQLPSITEVLKDLLDISDGIWHSQSEMLQEVELFLAFVQNGCKQSFSKYNALDAKVYRMLGIQKWPELCRKSGTEVFKIIKMNERALCLNGNRVRLYSNEIMDYLFQSVDEQTDFEISQNRFNSIRLYKGYCNTDDTIHPIMPEIGEVFMKDLPKTVLMQLKDCYMANLSLCGIFDWTVGYCFYSFPKYRESIEAVCQYCKQNSCMYLLDTMCFLLLNTDEFLDEMIQQFGLLDITRYAAKYYVGNVRDSKKFCLLIMCVCAGMGDAKPFHVIERTDCTCVDSVLIAGKEIGLNVNNFISIMTELKNSGVTDVSLSSDSKELCFMYS